MITDAEKKQLFIRLGCDPSEAKLLGGYNGNVFEINRGKGMVVKILERSTTAVESVLSEFEWLDYLHEHGLRVVKPLRLNEDKYIHPISKELYFVAFEKVNGMHVNPHNMELWNKRLFEQWGELMGKMHSLAKSYQATNIRPQWFQHSLLNDEKIHEEPLLSQKWKQYRIDFEKLSTCSNNFGLIHGDLHHHNFLHHGNELTLIDFGDSEYHWFAYDIAIVIYHTAQTVQGRVEREAFVRSFFDSFMNGYTRGNSNTEFISQIDYFIDYRHLFSYTYHSMYSDKSQLTTQQQEYLMKMKQTIIEESSYLGFNLCTVL